MSDITPSVKMLFQTQSEVNIDINMTDNQNMRMAEENPGHVHKPTKQTVSYSSC